MEHEPEPADPRHGAALHELGEDGVLARVLARYPAAPGWLAVPPGDDAAVLAASAFAPGGRVVVSMDTLTEGHDFRLDWSTPAEIGAKLAAQTMADLTAMGAAPRVLLVSLTAPSGVGVAFATGLADGLATECARAGAAMAGGDLSDGDVVVLTGCALGALPGELAEPVRRSGARPGDQVALAGEPGWSAAGLALLQHGFVDQAAPSDLPEVLLPVVGRALAAHRRPQPDYGSGPSAALAGATAMIDTSDGLLRDAARIATASGVVLALDSGLVGSPSGLSALAAHLGDPGLVRQWALTGGEDHLMLACFPPDAPLPAGFRRIGTVRAETNESPPTVLVDGRSWQGPTGWRAWRDA